MKITLPILLVLAGLIVLGSAYGQGRKDDYTIDLVIKGFKLQPSNPAPGSDLVVTVEYGNEGKDVARDFGIQIDLFRNGVPVGNRVWLSQNYLGPHQSSSTIASWENLIPGDYYIVAYIDPKDDIREFDEDNQKGYDFTVEEGKGVFPSIPDIRVSYLSPIPEKPTANDGITVRLGIVNEAKSPLEEVGLNINLQIPGRGYFENTSFSDHISYLAPGETIEIKSQSPFSLRSGQYCMYITAKLSGEEGKLEKNLVNNSLSTNFTVIEGPPTPSAPLPDLTVKEFFLRPTAPVAGSDVNITIEISNEGGGEAKDVFLEIKLSNSYEPIEPVSLGPFTLSPRWSTHKTCIFRNISPGDYVVWATIDPSDWYNPEGKIKETDERNNFSSYSFVVSKPQEEKPTETEKKHTLPPKIKDYRFLKQKPEEKEQPTLRLKERPRLKIIRRLLKEEDE